MVHPCIILILYDDSYVLLRFQTRVSKRIFSLGVPIGLFFHITVYHYKVDYGVTEIDMYTNICVKHYLLEFIIFSRHIFDLVYIWSNSVAREVISKFRNSCKIERILYKRTINKFRDFVATEVLVCHKT